MIYDEYRIAIIVGGWYFPYHLYERVRNINIPEKVHADFFVVAHRTPDEVDPNEMLSRIKNKDLLENRFDVELYSRICTLNDLKTLGYDVLFADNKIGDYYFFNQWERKYLRHMYDHFIFMHDDNYLLPAFKNILVDFYDTPVRCPLYGYDGAGWSKVVSDIDLRDIHYIANSAVGNRKTARGSFSIWSSTFINALRGQFPMDGVTLDRTGLVNTPEDRLDTEDWNNVGAALQSFVEESGFMDSTFRFSNLYRTSKYMIEGERGRINNHGVFKDYVLTGIKLYA